MLTAKIFSLSNVWEVIIPLHFPEDLFNYLCTVNSYVYRSPSVIKRL